MRTLIASAAIVAALAIPQLALAQAGSPANAAPYCMQNRDGSLNCSFQTMHACESDHQASPGVRCIDNPRAAATSGQGRPSGTQGNGSQPLHPTPK